MSLLFENMGVRDSLGKQQLLLLYNQTDLSLKDGRRSRLDRRETFSTTTGALAPFKGDDTFSSNTLTTCSISTRATVSSRNVGRTRCSRGVGRKG